MACHMIFIKKKICFLKKTCDANIFYTFAKKKFFYNFLIGKEKAKQINTRKSYLRILFITRKMF